MDIKKLSLIIVGFIWLLVGIILGLVGINWMLQLGLVPKLFIFLILACTIGLLKGKFVLLKIASRYYKRSETLQFTKNDIITGWLKILGLRGGILIALMILLGSFLRHSSINKPILGIIYLAVGIGLVYASKVFFLNNHLLKKE